MFNRMIECWCFTQLKRTTTNFDHRPYGVAINVARFTFSIAWHPSDILYDLFTFIYCWIMFPTVFDEYLHLQYTITLWVFYYNLLDAWLQKNPWKCSKNKCLLLKWFGSNQSKKHIRTTRWEVRWRLNEILNRVIMKAIGWDLKWKFDSLR